MNPNANLISTKYFLLLTGVVFVMLIFAFKTDIYNELNSLKLVPQPERFTELYFENSTSLPTEYNSATGLTFAFTIHNLENATTSYPYVVYAENPSGQKTIFMEGTTTLKANDFKTIDVHGATNHLSTTASSQVVVLLMGLNQQIDFYTQPISIVKTSTT